MMNCFQVLLSNSTCAATPRSSTRRRPSAMQSAKRIGTWVKEEEVEEEVEGEEK
jgi:hypothetical protein